MQNLLARRGDRVKERGGYILGREATKSMAQKNKVMY
jgi:hypothetical protein